MKNVLRAALLIVMPSLAMAGEPVNLEIVTKIRDEGLNRSQVMDTAWSLTDDIGPRLTNSPGMRRAEEWTRSRLEEWGLANAHLEPFEFGRGWSFSRCTVRMVVPQEAPLTAWPIAWTPGTAGLVRGAAILAPIKSEEDFEEYRGKLAGTIVLLDSPRDLEPPTEPVIERYDADELAKLVEFPIPTGRRPEWRDRYLKMRRLTEKLRAFLAEEGALAGIKSSEWDGGLVRVNGVRAYGVGDDIGVPGLVMAAEHYNRVARLVEREHAVELDIDVDATFHEENTVAHNVIAEIPGGDLKHQVVMLGAHLDSWHAGTGAADDAAGCAVVMEAVRILKAIGATPRRTVRVALWSSEEQGLNGSRSYIKEHFAFRAEPDDPEEREKPEWARTKREPLQFKPAWNNLAAYFNIDNGSGKLRGIYAQENAAVVPIFHAWLAPFHDLGADTVTMRNTRGTDHLSFDAVGLPGFQFVQDGLDYMTRTHHTQMDVYDRLQAADLKQAAVVLASFVYHAAMREGMLPRKPLPQERSAAGTDDD